jgi:hypothetical protein
VSLDTKADPMNAFPTAAAPAPLVLPTPVLPARPGSTANHRDAHALAEAAGGWLCAYCSATLVDLCALELAPSRDPEEPDGVYLIPHGYHAARIHHEPHVLACGDCIGRKSAEKSHAARAARKAAA